VAVLLSLAGCGGPHSLQIFRVSVVNDTSGAVVVRDCDSYCSSSPIAIDLQPGASTVFNRIARDHKIFSITTPSGTHVGCLDLYFATPRPGAQVPISHATPCRTTTLPWKKIALIVAGIGLLLLASIALLRPRTP